MLLSPKHPLLVLSTEFSELCKPLELFDIHHFTYQKQFNDGTRISLSNKPQWIEDYYNLGLYQSSLFEEKPSLYKAEFNVWTGEYDLDVYKHGKAYYNTADSITVTEPHNDGCEHYLFSTTPDNSKAIQYLANNMDILYHFIVYLKDHGAKIFKRAQKGRIFVQKSFDYQEKVSGCLSTNDFRQKMVAAKKLFFNKTPVHSFCFETGDANGIKLTQREIGCVINLLQNKTAEETAQAMNLSRRTVESYLDNIKVKLDCDTKAELMKKLNQNKFLYALKSVRA